MHSLKVKTTIKCDCCGCKMPRTKTIKVNADQKEDAILEANDKIKAWRKSLAEQKCKVCTSIIKDMEA